MTLPVKIKGNDEIYDVIGIFRYPYDNSINFKLSNGSVVDERTIEHFIEPKYKPRTLLLDIIKDNWSRDLSDLQCAFECHLQGYKGVSQSDIKTVYYLLEVEFDYMMFQLQ